MPEILGLPIGDVLPDDAIPVEAIIVVKYVDNGGSGYRYKETESLPGFEAYGMLQWAAENIMGDMLGETDNLDG